MKELLTQEEARIFGEKLAKLRGEWKLSRAKLATELKCSANFIYLIEKRYQPTSTEFVRITCKVFGMSYVQMTKSDKDLQELEAFGKAVKAKRAAKNISEENLATVIGESLYVLREIEAGRWDLTNRQRCALKNFLDLEEEKPSSARKTKAKEEMVILNDPSVSEASLEVIGAIVKYISDPEADKKTQKIIFRRLRDIETKILEEKIFA